MTTPRRSEDGRDTLPRTRDYQEEVTIVLSAIDCVLNGEKAVYISSDLTTGRRFYQLLLEWKAQDSEDLRQKLGEEAYRHQLITPNVDAANAFARQIREMLGGKVLVITPAPLIVPGWTQDEYLRFFETLIRTRISATIFNDGWEYSNGCAFEFVVAQEGGVPTSDARNTPMSRTTGLRLIERAVNRLEASGIEPVGLRRHLERLRDSVRG